MSASRANRLRPTFDAFDAEMMARALTLARKGEGYVEPNPMVGCVIAKNGRVLGQGYHRRFGGPHAEVEALRSCAAAPAGATVYCTLEPCSHFGKTPPCVAALIEARVSKVVIPLLDPNPLVHGQGVAALRGAGIEAVAGLLEEEAREVIAPFATRVRCGRPYVIAKWAQSLNGLLITPPGERRWISGEVSRRRVHLLRGRVDAIMVGARTVIVDDPLLTARSQSPGGSRIIRRTAARLIMDGRLRTPLRSRVVETASEIPTVIFTSKAAADSKRADAYRRRGVEVVSIGSQGSVIRVRSVLGSPALHDTTNLLLEGGPALLNQFFREAVVDEARVFVAPRVIPAIGRCETGRVDLGIRVATRIHAQRSGDDMLYTLRFAPRDSA